MNTNVLKGKNILITGSSSGLGKACAQTVDTYGANVILVARTKERLEEVAATLKNQSYVFPLDLSECTNIPELFENLRGKDIKLDGIIHAAGVSKNIPVSGFQYNSSLEVFNVNFFSFCQIMKYASKSKYMNKNSSIVAVSSTATIRGNRTQGIYAASKAALEAYVRIAAKELIGKNIRVNAIQPAGMMTEMAEAAFQISPEYREYAEKNQKLGFVDLKNAAQLIAFLLSDMSKYMSGLSVPIDAGLLYCSGDF